MAPSGAIWDLKHNKLIIKAILWEFVDFVRKKKKLIEAHIIPKFMFKKMKDENHSFYNITYNLDTKQTKSKKTQKEDYDKNILCGDCDNGIIGGIYEDYAKDALYGENLNPEIAPKCENFKNPVDGAEYSICNNIDYTKMKLFLLSLLWRASITDRPTFNEVNIGSKHKEILRKMIYENSAPSETEYPIIITSFMRTENKLDNMIFQPKRIRTKGGLNGYSFLIDSLEFIFFVNSVNHKLPEYVLKSTIKQSGELTTLHLPIGSEIEFLKQILEK
jgi:hypothetical protein